MADDRKEPSPSTDPYGLLAAGDAGVLGIDNVRLELPLAGIGSRMVAVCLDQIIIIIAAMLWAVLCMALGAALAATIDTGMAAVWVVMGVGIFFIDFAFYAFFEIRMGGRTPGKRALGLRTVNAVGGQASAAAIVVRNALRVFDYVVGALLVMIDRRHRRLGDMVASTLVIHDPVEPAAEVRIGRWPERFTAREIAFTEQLVRRIPRLLPERARELAGQFLAALRGRDPAFFAVAPGAPLEDPVFELWRLFEVDGAGHSGGARTDPGPA